MNIIGISGLENSMPFRRAQWPGLDEREYRISQGHDSAAALTINGKCVAAAAEERFSRKKHTGDFPIHAIQYCLAEAGLDISDIDELAHGFDYSRYKNIYSLDPISAKQYREVYSREALLPLVDRYLPGFGHERVKQVDHHLAHAASAYYTSGWDDCLVVIADGMAEVHSISVYAARDGKLEKLHQVPAHDSIGILYSLVTLHLGFDFNSDEYKIMGLAPYGNARRFRQFFKNAVELLPEGRIRIPILRNNKTRDQRENFTASREYLAENLVAARAPEHEITEDHRDVAAALQECLNEVMLHICRYFGDFTNSRRLAMAGGVA